MPVQYKALVVVIVITAIVFALAKPVFLKFMAEADYGRRRNAWFVLTAGALLIPSYWLFILLAVVVIAICAWRDSNPVAVYLMLLLVMPPITLDIGGLGSIAKLFPLNHLRLLSLLILLPALMKWIPSPEGPVSSDPQPFRRPQILNLPDTLIVLYCILQVVVMLPTESTTASLRRAFLLCLDVLLPYFAVSRCIRSRAALVDAIAAFTLSMIVLAPIGMFEFLRGWLLYASLESVWGSSRMYTYLMRGDSLRAQTTAGHSLAFGLAIAVAIGFWFYLQSRIEKNSLRWLGFLTLIGASIATLSRGPWIGAIVILLLFLLLGPNPLRRLLKTAGSLGLGCGVLLFTPYGSKIVDYLPFVGTVDASNVEYRQQLANVSWQLILQHPIFGSPYFASYMEEMRQGEGIIDIVNVYANIALNSGLVGVSLFAGVFLFATVACVRISRGLMGRDDDAALLGASLSATTGGVMVIIATVSDYLAIPTIYWSLAAMLYAYACIGSRIAQSKPGFVQTQRSSGSPAYAG